MRRNVFDADVGTSNIDMLCYCNLSCHMLSNFECGDAVSAILFSCNNFTVFSSNSWMQTAASLALIIFRHVFFFEGSVTFVVQFLIKCPPELSC